MCQEELHNRDLVENAVTEMTDDSQIFTALDVKHHILASTGEELSDQGRLVRGAFVSGKFPENYVMGTVRLSDSVVFAVYHPNGEEPDINSLTR